MATDTQPYYGQTDSTTTQGEWNAQRFMIQQQIMKLQTSLPVEVLAVYGGGVAPVGQVKIRVLVPSITGDDRVVDYPEIDNVPYMRLQGGTNAVIIDPEPGDMGMACFASRDISAVKSARQAAPPGSRRAYDFSDAMYCGGFLNKTPVQYIQFDTAGITVFSPTEVKVEAPVVKVDSPDVQIGELSAAVLRLIDERIIQLYNQHTHLLGPTPDVQLTPAMVATIHTKAN